MEFVTHLVIIIQSLVSFSKETEWAREGQHRKDIQKVIHHLNGPLFVELENKVFVSIFSVDGVELKGKETNKNGELVLTFGFFV